MSTELTVVDYLKAGGLIVVVFGIPLFVMFRLEKRRTAKLGAVAASLGATFRGKGSQQDISALLGNSHVASHGDTRRLTNLIEIPETGDFNIKLFDYFYCTGTGRSNTPFDQTVLRIQSPLLNLPEFVLHPESFLYKIGKAFGAHYINFPDFPEFNKMFTVQGADEPTIRASFTPAVIQYCQSKPSIIIEGFGDRLLVYRSNKRVKPDALPGFLDEGKQIGSLIFDGAEAGDADAPPVPISTPPPLPPPITS